MSANRKNLVHTQNPIRAALKAFMMIGELERLAGIDTGNPTAREAFWNNYKLPPGTSGLDAGVAQLLRRIEALAVKHDAIEHEHREAVS